MSTDWKALYVLLAILIFIELGFYLPEQSILRRGFGVMWLTISLLFLSSATVGVIQFYWSRELWMSRDWPWFLCAVVVPLMGTSIGIGGVTWSKADREGWMQETIASDFMHHDNALGVYQAAYGPPVYPARQFLLAYIPTALFGPSLVMARFGYLYYFILGYLAFLNAITSYLIAYKRPRPWLVGAALGCCVGLATYTQWWVRYYEQSMTPLCVTMFLLAGLLKLGERVTPYRLFWVAWSLGFLPYLHRSALAVIPMALACLVVLAFYKRFRCIALYVTIGYGVLATLVSAFIVTATGSTWNRILESNHLTLNEHIQRGFQQINYYIGPGLTVVPVPVVFAMIVMGYCSFKQRDLRFFGLLVWCVTSLLAAMLFIGYSFKEDPRYDLIRTATTVPFLVTALALFYTKVKRVTVLKRIVVVGGSQLMIVYMVVSGIFASLFYRMPPYIYEDRPDDCDLEIVCLDRFLNSGHFIEKLYVPTPIDDDDGISVISFLQYMGSKGVTEHHLPPTGEKRVGYYVMCVNWKVGEPRPDRPRFTIEPE